MPNILSLLTAAITGSFKTRSALVLGNLSLRHQINVLQRKKPKRLVLHRWDRILWAWLSRIWSGWTDALVIVKPATVLKWHQMGFKLYWWRLSTRNGPGRPVVPKEVRDLIRKMSQENPLWGGAAHPR